MDSTIRKFNQFEGCIYCNFCLVLRTFMAMIPKFPILVWIGTNFSKGWSSDLKHAKIQHRKWSKTLSNLVAHFTIESCIRFRLLEPVSRRTFVVRRTFLPMYCMITMYYVSSQIANFSFSKVLLHQKVPLMGSFLMRCPNPWNPIFT